MTELAERLGRPGERLVIVTADGLGASHAGNQGVAQALGIPSPLVTATSLQVPCPWARAGATLAGEVSTGIELTLNCAPEHYRWSSLTNAPSLGDGAGGLPQTVEDLLEHADTPEVLRECRAQLGRAQQWGVEPTHLTSHLDALTYRPEFFDVLLELAVASALPIRLPDPTVDLGFDARRLARSEGVVTPDRVVQAPAEQDVRAAAMAALDELEIGVTEIVVRPAADSPELRAITPAWPARVGDAYLVTHDVGFRSALTNSAASLLSWSYLRAVQRSG